MSGEKVLKMDSLLEPLLLVTNEQQADELLLRLISDHAEPLIKGIIRYKLHLSFQRADQRAEADDIYQEVLLQLLSELDKLRKQPEQNPISDVRGIAAVIAHRTCSKWMRRQFPERHAFKNRLQYLLTRQKGLALWQDKEGKLVAGFAVWQGKKSTANASLVGEVAGDKSVSSEVQSLKEGKQRELADAVAAVLNRLGTPIELDELVRILAPPLGIRDQPLESLDHDEDSATFQVATREPDPSWQAEKRIFLQRLWEELLQLPRNQRSALLLNLKDPEGRGCIALFPTTQIASIRQLAEALEISAEDLARLWNELPIEDVRIAELLGLTRQQVINARKSGRERLTRRLKGFI